MPMTREEIERRVLDDYRLIADHYIRVTYLKGYAEDGDTVELEFDWPGILVRVDRGASRSGDLLRWMDGGFIDPCWPVTPEEPIPGLAEYPALHGWEIFGHSYRFPSGQKEPTPFLCVPAWKAILLKARRAIA